MNNPENKVIAELEKYDLRCELFSKNEMKTRKTPDRKVYCRDEFAFYCEIKEIAKDDWLGGEKPDPIFNRISDDIHTAVKQFESVNPNLEHPNVLAFVNNDERCGSLDLVGVLTGHLLIDGDGSAPIYLKYSNGRIKDEKNRIHLYLWFDSFKANKFLFNSVDTRHRDRLCEYFGIDPKAIEMINV
jgi:hypothetical protein